MAMILYGEGTSKTAAALAVMLRINYGRVLSFTGRAVPENLVIRWGNSMEHLPSNMRTLNTSSAVAKAVDKLGTLEHLQSQGIQVPRFWETDTGTSIINYPLFGRKRTHAGGTDIVFILNPSELDRARPHCDFFTQYVPSIDEYRVHVFDGVAKIVQKKTLPIDKRVPHYYIKNHRLGWIFQEIPIDRAFRSCKDIAQRTAVAIGLDFCAIDILRCTDGTWCVLEVNTAPGLVNNDGQLSAVGNKYVEYFRSKLSLSGSI